VQSLFDKTVDFNDDVFRNITSLRESEDLFDDLSDGHEFLSNVARTVEMKVKSTIPPGIISRGFHYTTAIDYPFMQSHTSLPVMAMAPSGFGMLRSILKQLSMKRIPYVDRGTSCRGN
jgi:hypothetical protein